MHARQQIRPILEENCYVLEPNVHKMHVREQIRPILHQKCRLQDASFIFCYALTHFSHRMFSKKVIIAAKLISLSIEDITL